MSTGKLDQSLDEIMKDSKTTRGRGRGGRRNNPRRAAVVAKSKIAAPAGGIVKSTKPAKATRAAPAISAPLTGDSKIIVSGLPEDVDETQIKDYFSKTIGQVKKAMLTYGPNGRSRGIATIIFNKPGSAAEAAKQLNGVKVDNRAMRIEVVVGAKNVAAPPPPKTLSDRISQQPRNAAKERTKTKVAVGARPVTTNGATKDGRGGKKKSGRVGRPKPKTAEELDAEMKDYFGGDGPNGTTTTGQATTNGTAQPAALDTGMADEIS